MRAGIPRCRITWRPSRWEQGAVLLLGACAAGSVLASDLAWPMAPAVAATAAVAAVAQAHRSGRRAIRRLAIADGATLDGERLASCSVAWRGPLAFLQARDAAGTTHRLAWWPDTLSRTRRRALRLALDAVAHAASR